MSTTAVKTSALNLMDRVAALRPNAGNRRDGHVAGLRLEDLGGITMHQLAEMHNNPDHPMNEMVEVVCKGIPGRPCPDAARFQCRTYFSEVTVCDACQDAYVEQDRLDRMKKAWEHLCPIGFRDTDKAHAGFPKVQLASLKDWAGTENLVLYGPSGKGKTRLAMLLLKRAMLRSLTVGVLWPERLRLLGAFEGVAQIEHYTMHDVLLLDDPFITACRENKLVDAIKQLIDARMRAKRATIITTQVGTLSDLSEGKDFGEAKAADLERLKAIIRRVSEAYKLVPFVEATPAQGESTF